MDFKVPLMGRQRILLQYTINEHCVTESKHIKGSKECYLLGQNTSFEPFMCLNLDLECYNHSCLRLLCNRDWQLHHTAAAKKKKKVTTYKKKRKTKKDSWLSGIDIALLLRGFWFSAQFWHWQYPSLPPPHPIPSTQTKRILAERSNWPQSCEQLIWNEIVWTVHLLTNINMQHTPPASCKIFSLSKRILSITALNL